MSIKENPETPFTRTSASNGKGSPEIVGFYEPDTGSCQYVCIDPETRATALIDVVLNFDPVTCSTNTQAADHIVDFVRNEDLKVEWILDTHPHADHFTAGAYLKEIFDCPTGIGEKTCDIAELWRDIYNLPDAFSPRDDFDRLFADGDTFKIGNLDCSVMLSPGHTLGSVTYRTGTDAAFVHDTFMHVDSGTARADFPGASVDELFDSLHAILDLPDKTRLFIGHDYGTDERHEPAWEATVAEHRANNIHVGGGVSKSEYVKIRTEKDQGLTIPDRMLYALHVNLRGGRLPEAEPDGHSYFKIPANRF